MRRAALALLALAGAATEASAASAKWSSFGFGRRAAPHVGRCYKICPPVVYPWGHDPYYDSPYYIHEQELHGGPYGLGTLNPWGTNKEPVAGDASHPVAGHWPGIRRPVVPMQAPTAVPDSNPFPQLVPANQAPFSGPDTVSNRDLMFNKRAILEIGGNPADFGPEKMALLQMAGFARPSAYRGHPKRGARAAQHAAPAAKHADRRKAAREEPAAPALLEVAAGHPATKHFMPPCYHVCPTQDVPNPDDEPQGGPFGPDPYVSPRAKRMFKRKGKLSGFGNFYNPLAEPYGGPFGPDPYFEYGSHGTDRGSGQGNPAPGFMPRMDRS